MKEKQRKEEKCHNSTLPVAENPGYPSIHDAVKGKTENGQSSDAVKNYICQSEAVKILDKEYKEKRLIEETQGQPIINETQGTQDNPRYPSVEDAVKSCPNPAEMSGDKCQERHTRKDITDVVTTLEEPKSEYPTAALAVVQVTERKQETVETLSETVDETLKEKQRKEEKCHNSTLPVAENPGYPSIHDAVKGKTENGQSSDAVKNYICQSEAVKILDKEYKEKRLIEETQGQPIINETQGTQDNPRYPSVEDAVKSCPNPAEMSGDKCQERHTRKDITDVVTTLEEPKSEYPTAALAVVQVTERKQETVETLSETVDVLYSKGIENSLDSY